MAIEHNDTERLDFMLDESRKVVHELRLDSNPGYLVYIEEGFMSDHQYTGVKLPRNPSPEAEKAAEREAIDIAIEEHKQLG